MKTLSNKFKSTVNALAAIEVEQIKLLGGEHVASMFKSHVDIIRNINAGLGCYVLSSNPTMLLQCGSMFISNVKLDEDRRIIGSSVTCDPTEAYKFPAEWAQKNKGVFKNGAGEHFVAVNEKAAEIEVLNSVVESLACMVNGLIQSETNQVETIEQIQGNYFGEFYKHDNSGVAAYTW